MKELPNRFTWWRERLARAEKEDPMPYELFVKRPDIQSERIMAALLDRGVPFVEIQLSEHDAEVFESVTGRTLPFVMRNNRVIGGFADLVNHLRRPAVRQAPRVSC